MIVGLQAFPLNVQSHPQDSILCRRLVYGFRAVYEWHVVIQWQAQTLENLNTMCMTFSWRIESPIEYIILSRLE